MSTGVELATAWIRLVPSMDGVTGEVSKSLGGVDTAFDSAGKKSGGKFSKAAGVAALAGAAVIAAGLVKVFNTGMEELKFGEQLNAQTDVLIKNTGFAMSTGDINDYTLALSKVSGISEEDLQSAGNEVLKFGNLSEENYKKAVDGINNMGAAGKDTSAVGMALGKALADPAKAAGLLKKQGILLSESQQTLIDKFVETGDMAGAQGVILDSVNSTYDGMAEKTGGTLQGNLDKLNNQFENISGDLVSSLMPAITGFVTVLGNVATWISENQTVFGILVGVLGFVALAVAGVTVATWAMNTALLANPITWIILGIVAAVAILIAIVVLLAQNWDAVMKWVGDVWNGFVSWLTASLGAIGAWWSAVWTGIGNWIKSVWQGFTGWITGVWNGFLGWLRAVVGGLVSWWNGVWSAFGAFIKAKWDGIVSAVRGAWSGVVSWLRGAVGGFVSWWNSIWEGVGRTIRTVFSNLGSFIGGIWGGIVGGIRSAVNSIIRIVNGLIDGINGIVGAAGKALGLNISIPRVPMLANGGVITGSGTVLVGERGPELLNLPRGASVDPDISHLDNKRGDVIFKNYAPIGQSPAQALSQFANRAGGLL